MERELDFGALVGGLVALALAILALWLRARERARAAELAEANAALKREVEERQHAEEVLRASEARLRTLVSNFSNGAIFLVDRDLRYLVADGRALHPAGLSRQGLEGKALIDTVPPEEYERLEPLYRATLAGTAPEKIEIRYGDRLYVDYPVPVRGDGDEIIAAMMISLDVTEVRRVEEERRRIQEKLEEAQRLESLGVLAGGIAHDFNNMLTAILGHAELLRQDLPAHATEQENVDAIVTVTKRASDLVKQMLAYAGKGRISLRPLDFNALIRDLGELLRASVAKHARVQYELADTLPAVVADAAQLRQIVMNLIVNASEAIEAHTSGEDGHDAKEGDDAREGEASRTARGGTILVSTALESLESSTLERLAPGTERAPGPYVKFTVSDSGTGMDAETVTKIFQPFFSTKFVGRGLGLAAVHGIVQSHQGLLLVESEPKQGTTFRVWLPASELRPDEELPPPSAAIAARQRTVLVIDDEEVVRVTLQRTLERIGFVVRMAEGGEEGLAMLQEDRQDTALAMVDLTMPDMPGDHVVRELLKVKPDVPVILMSGYCEEDVTARYGELGHTAFLHKPFSLDELRTVVRTALEP
ncbi:hybrid sensor histidine kinase/response regulator [Chondromyces crocatus]|nr:response regulator [Chondromyces crocatus]